MVQHRIALVQFPTSPQPREPLIRHTSFFRDRWLWQAVCRRRVISLRKRRWVDALLHDLKSAMDFEYCEDILSHLCPLNRDLRVSQGRDDGSQRMRAIVAETTEVTDGRVNNSVGRAASRASMQGDFRAV